MVLAFYSHLIFEHHFFVTNFFLLKSAFNNIQTNKQLQTLKEEFDAMRNNFTSRLKMKTLPSVTFQIGLCFLFYSAYSMLFMVFYLQYDSDLY